MLNEADTRLALEAAYRLMEVVELDDFPQHALDVLALLVPGEALSYTEVDPVAQRHISVLDPPDFTADQYDAFARYAIQNPLVAHFFSTGDGRAHTISEFMTLEELRRTQVWQRAYGPMGLNYQLAVALPAELPLVIGIVVNRAQEDFTGRDRELLDLLRPHFARAHRNASLYTALAGGRTALYQMVDREGRSVGLLHGGARLEALSDDLAPQLERFFGDGDGIPVSVGRWLRQCRAVVEGGGGDESLLAAEHALTATAGDRTATLRVSFGAAAGVPDVLVLDDRPTEPDRAVLIAMGLTPREAEVAQRVAQACSNSEIGDALSIAPATVKKHVERVFHKLEVDSRVAASIVVRRHMEL